MSAEANSGRIIPLLAATSMTMITAAAPRCRRSDHAEKDDGATRVVREKQAQDVAKPRARRDEGVDAPRHTGERRQQGRGELCRTEVPRGLRSMIALEGA